ncbi:MAG: hypothetical protein D6812_10845, partial [Deltaproteobacteria bacterium]
MAWHAQGAFGLPVEEDPRRIHDFAGALEDQMGDPLIFPFRLSIMGRLLDPGRFPSGIGIAEIPRSSFGPEEARFTVRRDTFVVM